MCFYKPKLHINNFYELFLVLVTTWGISMFKNNFSFLWFYVSREIFSDQIGLFIIQVSTYFSCLVIANGGRCMRYCWKLLIRRLCCGSRGVSQRPQGRPGSFWSSGPRLINPGSLSRPFHYQDPAVRTDSRLHTNKTDRFKPNTTPWNNSKSSE